MTSPKIMCPSVTPYEARTVMIQLLADTGWEWDDPVWAFVAESDLVCPNGHKIEIDAKQCHCGEINPLVKKGLI